MVRAVYCMEVTTALTTLWPSWEGGQNLAHTVYLSGVGCTVKLMAVLHTINKQYKVPQLLHTTYLPCPEQHSAPLIHRQVAHTSGLRNGPALVAGPQCWLWVVIPASVSTVTPTGKELHRNLELITSHSVRCNQKKAIADVKSKNNWPFSSKKNNYRYISFHTITNLIFITTKLNVTEWTQKATVELNLFHNSVWE